MEKEVSAAPRGRQLKRLVIDNNSALILIALLCLSLLFVDGMTNSFYSVIVHSSIYGLVALGLSLVMITGNIDLSIGYQAGTAGVVAVTVFNAVYAGGAGSGVLALLLSAAAAMASGALTGALNGFVVTKVGVSPLITTIATNYIYKGIVFYFAQNAYSAEGDAIKTVAGTQIGGMRWLTPTVLIFVLFIAAFAFVMYKTRFGNSLYIVGDNPEAGAYAGISVSGTVWKAYIICGVLAALTGFFLVSRAGNAIYTQGQGLETFAISACVLGGIKMSGGKGTMVHVLLGVVIMRTIQTIMSTMFLPTAWVNFISGALLILVLIVDRITTTKSAER